MDTATLPKDVTPIWGDFNAIGLSDDADDDCIYSIDRNTAGVLSEKGFFREENATLFFVYDFDGNKDETVIGFLCTLDGTEDGESFRRARPVDATMYRGALPNGNAIAAE